MHFRDYVFIRAGQLQSMTTGRARYVLVPTVPFLIGEVYDTSRVFLPPGVVDRSGGSPVEVMAWGGAAVADRDFVERFDGVASCTRFEVLLGGNGASSPRVPG